MRPISALAGARRLLHRYCYLGVPHLSLHQETSRQKAMLSLNQFGAFLKTWCPVRWTEWEVEKCETVHNFEGDEFNRFLDISVPTKFRDPVIKHLDHYRRHKSLPPRLPVKVNFRQEILGADKKKEPWIQQHLVNLTVEMNGKAIVSEFPSTLTLQSGGVYYFSKFSSQRRFIDEGKVKQVTRDRNSLLADFVSSKLRRTDHVFDRSRPKDSAYEVAIPENNERRRLCLVSVRWRVLCEWDKVGNVSGCQLTRFCKGKLEFTANENNRRSNVATFCSFAAPVGVLPVNKLFPQ